MNGFSLHIEPPSYAKYIDDFPSAGRLQYCAGDTEQYLWLLLILVKENDKGN